MIMSAIFGGIAEFATHMPNFIMLYDGTALSMQIASHLIDSEEPNI